MKEEAVSNFSVKALLSGTVSAGARVAVQGWVRTRRDSKAGLSFVALHDGSCFSPIQVVVPNTLSNYESDILRLTAGASIRVVGELVESPAKGQAFELQATEIHVYGFVEDPDTYPMSPKRHTLEHLRDHAHLRIRTNTIGAVARIRQTVALAIHQFFAEEGFCWVPTPLITASDCEGAGETFRVSTLDLMNLPRTDKGDIDFSQDFFGKETFLTVSGQLNAECYAEALTKVYTFGPTFRAENSNTSRHLAEFWMVEPEIAFATLRDDIALAEKMLKTIFTTVLNRNTDDMEFFAKQYQADCIQRLENMIKTPFETMTYTDAIDALLKSNKKFEFPVKWGSDLQSEHERYLTEEYLGRPVAVIDYPKEIKAFYMKLNDDEKTVAAMDVLAPGIGEIIGGSQREDRLNVLEQRMDEFHINKETNYWYLDLRRYGSVPHAGFGMGFERCLSYITGLGNLRDLIPFPRVPNNAEF